MAPTSPLDIGFAGRYEIERELGRGGMATVYLARDVRHDRDVALKVLRPDVASSIGPERFLREIRLAAKLSHPHILSLFDSGETGGLLFYVMPNVEGLSLRDRLAREGKLPVEEAIRLVREVADALDYAHRQGVVHRDIKPENIMLHEGHAMVADFGIGKALSAVDDTVFTQAGVTVGTPAYMSPEQAAGDGIDGRSDIYSLGCVLYELLTGEPPFVGATAQIVIAKRFVQTPADVSALREGVSRAISGAVQRALARAPQDRFETGAQLAVALTQPDHASRADAPDKSIAVLPFANMSADPENEFFADGITEEILNALAQIPDLRVAGRTSSFSFKGKNTDLRTIGDQLGVRTVLEGSVRRAGKRVRITAQLINVADGYHLWSERYDREVEDVFAVQDEIAAAIAERMKTALGGNRAATVEQRATSNIEAYEAYLKGRALLYRRGPATKQGIALMERALELDPEYGLAWAGLADAYTVLGYYSQLPIEIVAAKARNAADHALAAAPGLAEAHCARAIVSLLMDWNFEAAERGFKRAIELNPRYVQGAAWYYLFYCGFLRMRWDECIAGMQELERFEPLSAYIAAVLALAHGNGGDPDEAMRYSDRAIELEPTSFLSIWTRQMTFHARGEWAKAIETGDAVLAASGRHVYALQALASSHVENGEMDEARAVYGEMVSRSRREPISPTSLAMVAAAVGEERLAVDYCREAMRRRDPMMPVWIPSWRTARFLRAIPEVGAMLREANFAPPGSAAERRLSEVSRVP